MRPGATAMAMEMRERVAALKHDLAKYVAWRSANFDDEAWAGPMTDDFADALRADVLETSGSRTAWEVWRQFAEDVEHPLPHPELELVEAAVATLASHESALRDADHTALAGARSAIRQAQQEIRQALRALHRRLGTE